MFFNRIGHRSDAKKAEDDAFMQAIKNIDTLVVRDGRMSMDATEIEDLVRASRDEAKKLVKPAHTDAE
ncbi:MULTISPECIES: hypothetical protein [Pseudomonas]|jgi:hypothetical protein|uniref:hypothetical protein n=1 Tax=Pseudomonas TaxID=286 RepID=UPI0003AEFA3D|nr:MULTISPECIES: hypothetical protein [Pseudomonas]ERL00950.1 hypothetical protein O999_25210 [Pseudomonas putida LF54]MBO2889746.1 hypothetical protein [Pseudomonas asiatica]MCK2120155.1 hypothetical protein [Pseudomonas sp. PNPG3]MDN4495646.1 hypothetical protein [Pseudomonas mosselii]